MTEEKREILRSQSNHNKGKRGTIEMVEQWIQECTDSGVSPVDVSKEVLVAISNTHVLGAYATPELKALFNDWLIEIERLITAFVRKNKRVDSKEVAQHFKLGRDSVIFIISKLAREGKISMQASDNEPCRILPLKGKNIID